MQSYACPNCGANLEFQSSVSVYTTCTHCRSMVVRHDMNLENLGQVSELLQDMSPFQVGTEGKYEGKVFHLVGRIKVVYDKGTWSEWYALFLDGTEGWLTEAQGFYMMSFEEKDGKVNMRRDVQPMNETTVNGKIFYVDDARNVTYAASEGELPFVFQPNEQARSIDLRNSKGEFASVSFTDEGAKMFLGHYLPFEAFEFQNLRTLDGW
jgi:hypothetical protein